MTQLKQNAAGTLFVLALSALSVWFNDLLKPILSLEALTIAILLGIVINNTVGTPSVLQPGVKFSHKKLLKVGVVLLGFKLSLDAILQLGPAILLLVLLFVPLVLTLSALLSRLLDVDIKLSTLIGVGSSICGASAIVAVAPSIDADDEDSVLAVSVISLLGAIGVLVYTAITTVAPNFSPIQYGAWAGLSLQGVAHALAAAFALGDKAGEIGTLVKMTRVLMLVPVSILLGLLFSRDQPNRPRAGFPVYVLLFVLAAALNSLPIFPDALARILAQASSWLILMAMTAMGLSVSFDRIANKGVKALALGSLLFTLTAVLSLWAVTSLL